MNNILTIVGTSILMMLSLSIKGQTVDTVCFGTAPALFISIDNASGSLGGNSYIYEWQDSTAGVSWAAAPGINGNTNYQAMALTQNTWFRRQVRVLTCLEVAYSNIIEVRVLDSISTVLTNLTAASCDNTSDGSAEVSASGGFSGYSYSWSNGQTSAISSGLAPGTYGVTVTDDFGCTATETADIGFDNAAPLLQFDRDSLFMGQGFEQLVGAPGSFAGYEWSTGSTDSSTSVTQSGYLYLTVTNTAGCFGTDSIWIEITVGISANAENKTVKLYPNPARESVRLEVGTGEIPERIELRSIHGHIVRIENQRSVIDISNMAAGLYLVNVQQGGRSYTGRLVVQ